MIKQTITILALVLAMSGVAFGEDSQFIDLTPCAVLGNNNSVCTGQKVVTNFEEAIPSTEAVDQLMEDLSPVIDTVQYKHAIKSLETTVNKLLKRIAVLEKEAKLRPEASTVKKGYSILVPDVRYVGSKDGKDSYCYPLDTGIVGQYTWNCE